MPRKRRTSEGAPAQPVTVASGGAYGTRAASEELQRAVPLAAPSPGPTSSAPVTPPPVDPTQAALEFQPSQRPPLNAPTERPNEPLTAGLPVGPGPGPTPQPIVENPELIRQWLPALERLASQPDASSETRNFVRFLRSAV